MTQEQGTGSTFDNVFWDKKDAGNYVDIVSGDPDYIQLEFNAPG